MQLKFNAVNEGIGIDVRLDTRTVAKHLANTGPSIQAEFLDQFFEMLFQACGSYKCFEEQLTLIAKECVLDNTEKGTKLLFDKIEEEERLRNGETKS